MSKTKKPPLAARVKHNPVLLKRALADPGLRSKLPMKYLTVQQRKARNKNQWYGSPVLPNADVTNRDMARARQAQEYLQFHDPYQQVRDQRAQLAAQRTRDTGYFDAYQQQIADAQKRQAEFAKSANEAAASTVQSGVDASRVATDKQASALSADAAQRGGTFSEAALRQLADAAASARQLRGSVGVGKVAGDSVGQNAFLGGVASSAGKSKLEHSGTLDLQGRQIEKSKTELDSKKAQWRDKFYQDFLNEARRRTLENQAYNLNVSKVAAGAAADAADAAAKGQDTNQWGYTKAEWAALSTAERRSIMQDQKSWGKSGGKGDKPKKHKWDSGSDHISTFKDILAMAGRHSQGPAGASSMRMQKWLQAEAKRRGLTFPAPLVVAAAEVAIDGYIHKATAARIRKSLNIRVKPFGYPVK